MKEMGFILLHAASQRRRDGRGNRESRVCVAREVGVPIRIESLKEVTA